LIKPRKGICGLPKDMFPRPVTRGREPPKIFFAPLKKCVGHSLKNLGSSQKTLRPSWCPKLVTGLMFPRDYVMTDTTINAKGIHDTKLSRH